jgi:radical SAM superfamily enzyme YgiQ (UPF0313 family)
LTDDLYNDDERKIKTLYDEVWSKLPFKPEWISYLRLDLIWNDREQAKWLKESGCRLGSFGIETMHDKAGKFVGKGLGKERIMETLEYLREDWGDDVIVNALMIAGLPFEPEEYILKTMSWLHTTNLVHSYHYSPLWVTPPEHRNMILSQLSPMSLEYEKYKVTWGPDGWINNMGLTLKKVREMVAKDSAEHFGNYFPVDTMEYTELRAAGYTQDQLASREFNLQILDDVHNGRYNIPNLIDSRFDKIINISGQ